MTWKALLVGSFALAMSLPATNGVATQTAPSEFPATPEPEECTVTPRSPHEFRILLEEALTPTAATPTANWIPPTTSWPEGDPADAEMVATVVATVRESLACINAADVLASQALVTDEYLRQQMRQVAPVVDDLNGIEGF